MDRHPNVPPSPLAVGDHVRVVLHPHEHEDGCDEAPHCEDELGQTGRILGRPRTTQTPTHPFLVLFDSPCVVISRLGTSMLIPARHYASHELERLDKRS